MTDAILNPPFIVKRDEEWLFRQATKHERRQKKKPKAAEEYEISI